MTPSEVKLCCLIGHMTSMSVVTLCISLPSGGHPEVIQEIPIYSVGNQWCNTKNYHRPGADFVVYHGMIESSSSDVVVITAQREGGVTWRGSQLLSVLVI